MAISVSGKTCVRTYPSTGQDYSSPGAVADIALYSWNGNPNGIQQVAPIGGMPAGFLMAGSTNTADTGAPDWGIGTDYSIRGTYTWVGSNAGPLTPGPGSLSPTYNNAGTNGISYDEWNIGFVFSYNGQIVIPQFITTELKQLSQNVYIPYLTKF